MSHILIIEDEPLVALDLEEILERLGATSFDYADSEALAVKCAVKRRPDLITSDVKLVHGSGPGAVATILERFGHIPVIFITATPDQCGDNPQGLVLEKPVSARQIISAFNEVCRTSAR